MAYRHPSEDWVGARVQEIAAEMNAVDKSIHEIMSRLGASGPPPPSVLALYARREQLTRELVALAERT